MRFFAEALHTQIIIKKKKNNNNNNNFIREKKYRVNQQKKTKAIGKSSTIS